MDDEHRQIGRRIAALRDRAGLNNAAIAQAMGVSESAVKAWVGGASVDGFSKLGKLSSVLNVAPGEILGLSQSSDRGPPSEGTPQTGSYWKAAVEQSYRMLGLDADEASALAKVVEAAVCTQLPPGLPVDPESARHTVVAYELGRFLQSRRK